MDHEEKEIEVVSGDGSTLELSKVSDHITSLKPKQKETKKGIVIPQEKEPEKEESVREKTTISGIEEALEEDDLVTEENLEEASDLTIEIEELEKELEENFTLDDYEKESEDDIGGVLDDLYDSEENNNQDSTSDNTETVDIFDFDDEEE